MVDESLSTIRFLKLFIGDFAKRVALQKRPEARRAGRGNDIHSISFPDPRSGRCKATGRLSQPAMDLVQFIVKDRPNRSVLNYFITQLGVAIARYNAMAAHAWVQNYIRSSLISVGDGVGQFCPVPTSNVCCAVLLNPNAIHVVQLP